MSRAVKNFAVYPLFVLIAFLGLAANGWAACNAGSNPDCTTATLVASPASPFPGQLVTFTFTVTDTHAAGGSNGSPVGNATFTVDGGVPTIVALSPTTSAASAAQLPVTLATGTHSITANYAGVAGASGWDPVSASLPTFAVGKKNVSTSVAHTAFPVGQPVLGQSVTFAVTLTGSAAGVQLDGIVQLLNGGVWVGAAKVTPTTPTSGAGTATISIPSLSLGAHSAVSAHYLGNADFLASVVETVDPVTVTVSKRPSTSTISSLVPSTVGVNVQSLVNVQVADNGGGFPAGTPGAFAATGSLGTARSRHASALLPDGTVLVIGGLGTGGAALTSSEIYSGTFSAGLSLNTARSGLTATLLQDGTVLIVGGSNAANGAASGVLATVEIYDPVGNTVTDLATACTCTTHNLATARMNHTATLLANGTVLIAGGTDSAGTVLTSTEVYDPLAQTFSAGTALAVPRAGHTATLLTGGNILMAGGDGTGTAELYASATVIPNLSFARTFHTATLLPDGLVVLTGGIVSSAAVTSVEFYDPIANSFSAVTGTLDVARQGHTAVLLPNGTALFAGGSGTALPTGGVASAAIYTPPFDPQGTALITSSDVNDTVAQGNCGTLTLTGTGTVICQGSVTPTVTSTLGTHTITATYTDSGSVHVTSNNTASLNYNPTLTVTAQPDSKTYDGTTSSAVLPLVTGTLNGTDISCATQTFQSRNAAVGNAVTVPATTFVIRDTTCGGADHTANYYITYVNNTASTINPLALTVTAVTNTKTYDGTTSAAGIPTFAPALGTGDTPGFTEVYSDRNAGVGNKTLIPLGVVSDGNSGNNYTYTYVNFTTGTIDQLAITVTAVTNTKTYDGTTSAAAIPTPSPALGTGDVGAFTEAYSDRNAGVGNKTLIPSGVVTDGNGGANYTYVYVNFTTGTINQLAVTVTAVTNTKTYDGTTSAAAIPTNSALGTGDTAAFIEAYSDRNAGVGNKTLVPSGLVTDGNGGANYTYTYVNFTTGTINQLAITVTATTNTKTYDGTTSAAAIPTNSALGTGDVAAFIEAYSNKNAGVGNKTLIPSGLVTDGNGGANYTYTYVNFTTGTIDQLAITVTAVTNTKTYDGTTSAAAIPTPSPALGTGDVGAFTEAYSDRNAGVGNKTLIPSGVVTDGNGGNNYTYVYVNFTTGTINQLALTVTAVTNTKPYDGNTSAAGIPTFAPALGTGDTPGFSEVYNNRNAGVGNKTLIPSGVVNDGNGGANYTYVYVDFTTGTISPLALTVTAVTNTKTYDGNTSAAGIPTFAPALIAPDTPGFIEAYSDRNAGVGNKTLIPSGVVNDGNSGNNYTYTYVNFTTGTISPLALTVTAVTNTKTYDGTTTAAGIPTFAPALIAPDTPGFIEAYSDRNAGVGNKTLIPSGVVNDGNGGANYTYTYVNFTTGTIDQLALTVTAVTNTKPYDGTTSAAGIPTFAPALGTGDTPSFIEVYSDRNAGVGNKTLIPSGLVNDGNGGANYTYVYVNFTTGTISPLALTVTAVTNTKPYDGNTSAAGIPTFAPALIAPDTAGFIEVYSNRNAGVGNKTLIPSGLVNDGNGGANYTYTYVNFTTGTINPLALTVTAVTNTKAYDGTTSAAGIPTFAPALIAPDTPGFIEVYSDGNAGVGKTLIPSGLVADGNSGANYTYTYVNNTTGVITTLALTPTLTATNKPYDRINTEPNANMSCSVATVLPGDVANVSCTPSLGTFATANAGSQTVTATVTIGGTAGGNYTFGAAGTTTASTTATATASIITLAITPTLTAANKTYDGTTTEPNANMSCSLAVILAGDVANVTCTPSSGTFATANAGSQTVTATVTIGGTAGGNYTFGAAGTTTASTTATATASITKAHLTVTADNKTRLYLTADPVFTATLSGFVNGQTLATSGVTGTASCTTTATLASTVGAYPITCTLGTLAAANYDFTPFVAGTLTINSPATATFLASAVTVANTAAGGTFTLKATVVSLLTTGVPTGTVTFRDNGTILAGSPVTLNAAGVATLSSITFTTSTVPHAITADYTPLDTNYTASTITDNITVQESSKLVPPLPVPFAAGAAEAPIVSVKYSGSLTASGTLSSPNLLCEVRSAVVAILPGLTSCTASLASPLSAGGTGNLTITIHTTAGTIGALRPSDNPAGSSFRALYALSFGMPAIVFIGLAAPLSALRKKKSFGGKVVAWLGLMLVLSLLLLSIGCGGGSFSNPGNLGAAGTINKTLTGSYTAVVTYNDATVATVPPLPGPTPGNVVLATVTFSVN
jgi:hypothetical protein